MGRYIPHIVLILFASACGSGLSDELAATENAASNRPAIAQPAPSRPAALTQGAGHYHVAFQAWIPQYWVVDPSVNGLPTPYLNSLLIANFSNCWDPGWLAPITAVYSRFTGDNHVPYDGSYRSVTTVDFDWDGSNITNYGTNFYVGTSHRVLDYVWPGGLWWSGGSTECTEARSPNLYYPASSASGANFTLATMASDPFLPPTLATPLFGRLWGGFSGGNLTLSWLTGQFPSFGVRVQAPGLTYTRTVMDASGLGSDISSPTFIPVIAAQLNCWVVGCNTGSVTIALPSSSCAHPLCSTGVPLTSACSNCAASVCAHDPYCCQVWWDSICVSEVPTYCGSC